MLSTPTLIIIAIIVIITIILAVYWFYHSDFVHRLMADNHTASGETGAESMRIRNALKELESIKQKSPHDHYQIGSLISHNLLDDTPEDTRNRLMKYAVDNYMTYLDTAVPERNHINKIQTFAENYVNDRPLQDAIMRSLDTRHADMVNKSMKQNNKGTNRFKQYIHRENDSQNVHDASIVKSMGDVSSKIASYEPADKETFDNIKKMVRGNTRALHTLNTMAKMNTRMSSHDNRAEMDILMDVYRRSFDPRNDELCPDGDSTYGENIRKNLVLQMADASSLNGSTTCSTGRVSRVLQSLTLNDYEQREADTIGGTVEDYKNDIFKECNDDLVATLAGETDVKPEQDVIDLYKGKTAEAKSEEHFKEQMKERFNAIIDKYGDKLTKEQMDKIKIESYSAIE